MTPREHLASCLAELEEAATDFGDRNGVVQGERLIVARRMADAAVEAVVFDELAAQRTRIIEAVEQNI